MRRWSSPRFRDRSAARWSAALLALGLAAAPATASADKATRLAEAYDELTADSEALEGLLTLRRKEGKVYADLEEDDLDTPYLLFPNISRGIGEAWVLGGQMHGPDDWVFELRRHEDRILVVRTNVRFTADDETPMAQVVETAYGESIMASLRIRGEKDGRVLIRLDPYLTGDLCSIAADLTATFGGAYRLVPDRSQIRHLGVYEENLEIQVDQTFAGGPPHGLDTVPDPRSLGLTMHYSVLALPENDFVPRPADDRVGHFLTARQDHSSTDPEGPWRRYVNRWDLRPSDPEADASPVEQPVIFYISRAVPYEYRPYVREGILAWQKAFDAIGLLDAIEVRQQGPTDDWEAADVRYHTFQWVSEARFAGKGPSRAHPKTGQLLDADISYNGSVLGGMQRRYPVFAPGEPGPGEAAPAAPGACAFQAGFAGEVRLAALHYLAEAAGATAATTGTSGPAEVPVEFLGAALRKTVIHEVGHVLGLRHNFKGSTGIPADKLHDPAYTREHGVTASIMDYPAANLAAPGETQGEYFSSTVGAYDMWAIEYAYAPLDVEDEEDAAQVRAALDKIAARGAAPGLAYGSDEDRWTGHARNLDPTANVYDLGDDGLAYARGRLRLVAGLWDTLLGRVIREGEGYARARYATRVLLGQLITVGRVVTPFVGGQRHHRDHRGDPDQRPVFEPVSAARQREAVELLCETVFSDAQYDLPADLLNQLAPGRHRHWGAAAIGDRLDFPLHRFILKVQRPVLDRLLDPALLARLADAPRQAPPDAPVFTAADLVSTLVARVFSEAEAGDGPVSAMRRNLQRALAGRLADLVTGGDGAASDATVLARHALARLRRRLDARAPADGLTAAHYADLSARIGAALDATRYRQGL